MSKISWSVLSFELIKLSLGLFPTSHKDKLRLQFRRTSLWYLSIIKCVGRLEVLLRTFGVSRVYRGTLEKSLVHVTVTRD